jgi:hypothetical protein
MAKAPPRRVSYVGTPREDVLPVSGNDRKPALRWLEGKSTEKRSSEAARVNG